MVNYKISTYHPTEQIISLYKVRDYYKHQLEYCESPKLQKQYSQKIIALHNTISELRNKE